MLCEFLSIWLIYSFILEDFYVDVFYECIVIMNLMIFDVFIISVIVFCLCNNAGLATVFNEQNGGRYTGTRPVQYSRDTLMSLRYFAKRPFDYNDFPNGPVKLEVFTP